MSMHPTMRLEYGPKSYAISEALFNATSLNLILLLNETAFFVNNDTTLQKKTPSKIF